MREGARVTVESYGSRSAPENALAARVPGSGQPIDLIAAVVINIPWMRRKKDRWC